MLVLTKGVVPGAMKAPRLPPVLLLELPPPPPHPQKAAPTTPTNPTPSARRRPKRAKVMETNSLRNVVKSDMYSAKQESVGGVPQFLLGGALHYYIISSRSHYDT